MDALFKNVSKFHCHNDIPIFSPLELIECQTFDRISLIFSSALLLLPILKTLLNKSMHNKRWEKKPNQINYINDLKIDGKGVGCVYINTLSRKSERKKNAAQKILKRKKNKNVTEKRQYHAPIVIKKNDDDILNRFRFTEKIPTP